MAAPSPRRPLALPELGGWGRSNVLWIAVSASMLVLLALAAWLVVSDTNQPLPPFLRAGTSNPTPPPRPQPSIEGLRLAGSGSNLPMTRALSAAFPRDDSHHPVVHASIGSGGGVQALLDGVIDIALVSRPVREGEAEQGLVATPYARIPVVVAAHSSAPHEDVGGTKLIAIYEGSLRHWSDGSRIVVLQREREDSSHAAVDRVLPSFAAVNEQAYRQSRWRVLYRDDAMREALADTRGAIGLFGQGTIPPGVPIQALTVDGVAPSPETVADGTYPFTKELAFVTRGSPQGETAAFIAFARSPAGQRIIHQYGGVPIVGRVGGQEQP